MKLRSKRWQQRGHRAPTTATTRHSRWVEAENEASEEKRSEIEVNFGWQTKGTDVK